MEKLRGRTNSVGKRSSIVPLNKELLTSQGLTKVNNV